LARLRAWQSKECVRGVLEQLAQIAPERAERPIGGVRDFFKAFHRGDWRLEEYSQGLVAFQPLTSNAIMAQFAACVCRWKIGLLAALFWSIMRT